MGLKSKSIVAVYLGMTKPLSVVVFCIFVICEASSVSVTEEELANVSSPFFKLIPTPTAEVVMSVHYVQPPCSY